VGEDRHELTVFLISQLEPVTSNLQTGLNLAGGYLLFFVVFLARLLPSPLPLVMPISFK
jgi:hypothetical protein